MNDARPRVLFLCTGNSCRSQMAEGFARELYGDRYDVASAGIEMHGLNPRAVAVMSEVGVDISRHRSKTVAELTGEFDHVVTVCGHAAETCPVFPARVQRMHQGFDDPPRLAAGLDDEEAILDCYRRIRNEIRQWIDDLPGHLAGG